MARKTAATNDKALAAFVAAKTEIDRLLAELAALSTDHFHTSPDEITCGHDGSANHRVHAILQESPPAPLRRTPRR
ncbi:MAG: hypothetical protein MUE52_12490 [Tabrizicola sp.]|nr:hypothetical protein [Tabrizicola sp.]